MKIGIDANALGRPYQHGTRRYAEELIWALADVDKKNSYYLYTYKKIKIPKQKNFNLVILPKFPVLKRQFFLPLMVKKAKLDVFHNIDPFGSVFLVHPHLVTSILDIDLKTVYPTFRNIKYFIKRYYAEAARYFILKNSKMFIAISNNTLSNLEKLLDKMKIKKPINMIYLGVSSGFFGYKKARGIGKYFLAMGDFSPRKNLNTVFSAYYLAGQEFRDKYGLKVVVSTKEEAIRIRKLSIQNLVSGSTDIVVSPDDGKLKLLYRSAIGFLYPSLYEGFGLPILEAMASGCPVVTSNRGVLKEVAGDAAILVNPVLAVQIKEAMQRLVNNIAFRKRLIKKGVERAKKFRWKTTAKKTLEVYKKAATLPPTKHSPGRILVALCVFFVLLFALVAARYRPQNWSSFVVNGKIPDKLFLNGDTLMFGTNSSKLFFLNTKNDEDVRSVDLNSGSASLQQIIGNKVLVISDDSLRLIDIKSKNIIWHVTTGNEYFFVYSKVHKKYVLAGSADGSLTAFDLKSGQKLWRFTPKPLAKLSSIAIAGYLYYFGSVDVVDDNVYFDSQDQTFYALKLRTGELIWKNEINEPINTDIEVYQNYIFLTTRSGISMALDRSNGEIVWRQAGNSTITCSNIHTSFVESDIPQVQIILSLKQRILRLFSRDKIAFFELRGDGTFVRRNGRTGEIEWQTKSLGVNVYCPTYWRSEAILASGGGKVSAVSLGTGNIIFEKSILGTISNSLVVFPKFGNFIPRDFDIFAPRILVANTIGVLRSLNGKTGNAVWEFDAKAPMNVGLLVDNKHIFMATTDGVIHKLNRNTGLPVINSSDKKFEISVASKKVAEVEMFEISLKSKGKFRNPWRQASLDVVFTNEKGRVINMPGFYYDDNTWKVLFNPPTKGKWKWNLSWSPHGAKLSSHGEFFSSTDTSNFYLRISDINPKRFTTDGKNIFNGFGLGDSMYDLNYNGTSLDDWAIGNSSAFAATSSSGFIAYYKSDIINTLDDYISVYGPRGAGFNIFRWSLMNASQSLYTNLGFPTTYSNLQTKIGDRFAESLRSNNIHLWFTMFGFDIPYKDSTDSADRYVLKSYVRYVYARYGPFVDVWEIANELGVPKNTAQFIRDEISQLDFEKRPISVSSNDYNVMDGDVVAPHWYETEDLKKSDFVTVKKIYEYEVPNKPLVFSEQGNLSANYDSTSAIRMRVRSWTAFFNQAILMFWNQSDRKDFKAGIFPGNIYLGEEERGYTKVLQNLTKSIPLNAKSVHYDLGKYGVRGYGLSSEEIYGIYFFHYASPFTGTGFVVNVASKSGGKVRWYNPENGQVMKEGYCSPGLCTLSSPLFKTDTVLFITPEKSK